MRQRTSQLTRGATLPTTLLAVSITVAAVAGGGLAVSTMGSDQHPAASARQHPAVSDVGRDIRTSFGVVAVQYVTQVAGVTNRALSGASHGVQNLVPAGRLGLQVGIAVTNQGHRRVYVSPDQFRLLVDPPGGRRRVIAPVSGTVSSRQLPPAVGVEGSLGFVIPAERAHLSVSYLGPGQRIAIVIDLGTSPGRARSGPTPETHTSH